MTYEELEPEARPREHGMPYKLVYLAAVFLPRPLLVLGGIAAGVDVFVRQTWLGVVWGCLVGLGVLLFGVAKIMDFDGLRGFPGATRAVVLGSVSVFVGVALIVCWIVFAAVGSA